MLVAYNAHYFSKYLQTFTLHHISTNCSSINKGTIPEVLANIVFIFSTAPFFLVRSRSSTVSRLTHTPLLSPFSKGAFALEPLPSNLLICQTHGAAQGLSMTAWRTVLSHCGLLQGPCTHPVPRVRTLQHSPGHKEEITGFLPGARLICLCN